ncbi:TetR/AcrR family transcriptional regulator [Endozoicomonas sp. 8E]|uniref:TetR/AcrR family transcriptional regulator n=1 Tax=Endozoicomonas sp. 8E TaxID=3035692 RepID=UPI0029391743|nr:TetR/AcrR family transcriptional regulator [Endozoicomonas sp. 8E]WOG27165.1 TetR/AcrR family transcriptional regulator [Endozoicomonas sp. 8E]
MAVKTRDRILDKALELFNDRGERTVTTNHIAADLGISPGNLYYHFRNKDEIILALFQRLIDNIAVNMVIPEGRPLNFQDKRSYLELALAGMWEFRFIYRDVHGVMGRSSELRSAYQQFARLSLEVLEKIIAGLVLSGFMVVPKHEVEALALNNFMVLSSWQELVSAAFLEEDELLPKKLYRRAFYQILLMDRPYVSEMARESFAELEAEYFVPMRGLSE